jgi:hypothetical protein
MLYVIVIMLYVIVIMLYVIVIMLYVIVIMLYVIVIMLYVIVINNNFPHRDRAEDKWLNEVNNYLVRIRKEVAMICSYRY